MCGRLNVTDDPAVRALCESLGIEVWPQQQIFRRYIGAAQPVSIVHERAGQRRMDNAIWWLLLEPSDNGFKPSRYTSINTRYDSLNNPRKAGYRPFREHRIAIPVKGFGESEYKSGKMLHCHDMEAKDGALLMAGLAKEYLNKQTGEITLSCSIITLPPHPKLQHIHSKSTPMMLPQSPDVVDFWLDPTNRDTEELSRLLTPSIHQDLTVQQIVKPKSFDEKIGQAFDIVKDD